MTDARLRSLWHRSGPISVLGMLAVAAANPGCSCDDDPTPSDPTSTGTGASTSSSSSSSSSNVGGSGAQGGGGAGAAGGTGAAGGSSSVGGAAACAQDKTPFDATPDPDGQQIYFTAYDPTLLGAGIYKVSAVDCAAVTEVFSGPPLVAPFGIAIGMDGTQLYIADSATETDQTAEFDDKGQIFVLPVGGGTPAGLAGTLGYAPRSLEIADVGGDQLFFSGQDPATGTPGVYQIAATGGNVTTLFQGAPLADPAGVAVTKDGATVYVTDARASGEGRASIYAISGGNADLFLENVDVGYPAGIALTSDETTLLVSGLDPNTLTDVVLLVDVATKMVTTYTGDADTDFSTFEEPAGLHRAKNKDVFAWADSKANNNGTVFVIGTP